MIKPAEGAKFNQLYVSGIIRTTERKHKEDRTKNSRYHGNG